MCSNLLDNTPVLGAIQVNNYYNHNLSLQKTSNPGMEQVDIVGVVYIHYATGWDFYSFFCISK